MQKKEKETPHQKDQIKTSFSKTKMEANLEVLRESFKNGRTRSFEWRKNQLSSLIQFMHDKENVISEALYQDLGKHPVEIFRDEVNF